MCCLSQLHCAVLATLKTGIPPTGQTERAMLSALGADRVAVCLPRWSDFELLFIAWKNRIRSRYELEQLNERDLADMGLTRSDAFDEIQKPFWQA
jgi:uncharacterized protein YjiS (DUF1127 family)